MDSTEHRNPSRSASAAAEKHILLASQPASLAASKLFLSFSPVPYQPTSRASTATDRRAELKEKEAVNCRSCCRNSTACLIVSQSALNHPN